jgi:hypothetical protein
VRYLSCVLILAGLPIAAAAQAPSPTLPRLGGPLPSIGLPPQPLPSRTPWWEQRRTPSWERRNPPPWEKGHVSERDRREAFERFNRHRDVVYVQIPYPVAVAPQPIIVAQPANEVVTRLTNRQREEIRAEIEDEIERIVEERLKARESARTEPPAAAPPPPQPTGSKTLYLIPGCYMGNVSPKEMKLPEGCDLSKLTVINP